MRPLIFCVVLVLSACATGTAQPPYSGPAAMKVVEVPGKNQAEIYEGARQWIAENFKSSKAVIEYESRDTFTVIGNAKSADVVACVSWGIIKTTFDATCMHPASMLYTMKVESKDGRMRISVPNIALSRAAYSSSLGSSNGFELPADAQSYALLSERVMMHADEIVNYLNSAASSDF